MRTFGLFCAALAVTGAFHPGTAGDDPPPLPSELKESVEVRLVVIDVIALDDEDRLVPDLTKDDFELYVDRKKRSIDTFDVACEGDHGDDPKSKAFAGWTMPADLATGTRRVVLAFDYLHVKNPIRALQDYQTMFAEKTGGQDEELMVVALTGGLRVEQPFTRDRAAVIATLRRMENDITLWNGQFDHLTEMPLFAGLSALVTVLHTVPGPKAVVLLTAGSGPSLFYQLFFDRLAAAASEARVAIYPVDTRGVVPPTRYRTEPIGEPAGLWRFALYTGGRVVANTNDDTVGYARARRDLGCRYTLGFYDRKPEEDKQHELRVDSLRRGVHFLAAARYSFPSNRERLKMAVEAAYLVPEMFEGGGLRAHVFPLQPKDASTWDALVDFDFPIPPADTQGDATVRNFGVVLQRNGSVVHTFNRSISLQSAHPADDPTERRITFLEPAAMRPGRYVVTAVLSDPTNDKPFSYRAELSVPPIPKGKVFLTGPILGRRSGDDVVVYGHTEPGGSLADRVGDDGSFRPLLVTEANRQEPLAALTHACVLKPPRKVASCVVSRTLLAEDGTIAGTLPDLQISWEGKKAIPCRRIFDELPVGSMRLGRYTFRATLADGGAGLAPIEATEIPFALIAPTATTP